MAAVEFSTDYFAFPLRKGGLGNNIKNKTYKLSKKVIFEAEKCAKKWQCHFSATKTFDALLQDVSYELATINWQSGETIDMKNCQFEREIESKNVSFFSKSETFKTLGAKIWMRKKLAEKMHCHIF